MYQFNPGNNGNFDGLPPTGGDQVTNFDTTSLGVTDPEGINFDSDSGHLYIVGQPETSLAQVTTTGSLVRMVDISAANALKPAGLAYAPGLEETPYVGRYMASKSIIFWHGASRT